MADVEFKDRQVTGNVGLFFTCYKLSRMGWNVLPTSRNARGIDILAYGKHGEKFLTIQTKGYTKKRAIGPFKAVTDVISDFYIVSLDVYRLPSAYILSKSDVRSLLKLQKDRYWLEYKDYDKPDFLEKWNKIGFGFNDDSESEQIIKIDNELNESRIKNK